MNFVYWSRFTIFILVIPLTLLGGIYTFGATKFLLTNSTFNIQIDTRNSTLNDVLGGFEFYDVMPSSSLGSTTTAFRPSSIRATATQTSTTKVLSPTNYATAQDNLRNITDILEDVIASPNTLPGFNIARVFGIHDHIILGTAGFTCYSDNFDKDAIKVISSTSTQCPTNGFLKCLGYSDRTSVHSSSAFMSINKNYLLTMTDLDEDLINAMATKYLSLITSIRKETQKLNLPASTYNQLRRLSCNNDRSSRYNTGPKNTASNWIMGLMSVIFLGISLLIPLNFVKFTLWITAFGLCLGQFGLALSIYTPAANGINTFTEGTLSKGKTGIIRFFIPMLIFHCIMLFAFGVQYLHEVAMRKQYMGGKFGNYKTKNRYFFLFGSGYEGKSSYGSYYSSSGSSGGGGGGFFFGATYGDSGCGGDGGGGGGGDGGGGDGGGGC